MTAGLFSSRGRLALSILGALFLALPAAANAAAPVIPTTSASNVTETSALVQGAVSPRQSSAETHFEYVDQASYEASGFASATKTEDVKVPLTVKGKGDLLGPVEATGDLTENSAVITNLNVTSGSFSLGQPVTGENIPPLAKVKAFGPNTLTLTVPVEAGKSKNGVALTGVASNKLSGLSTESGTFVPGQTISVKGGKGIKAGTSILAASADSLTLSQPATETINAAELTATTTFAQGSGDTEDGGVFVSHVTPSAGTFLQGQILTGPGIRADTTIKGVQPDIEPGKTRLESSRPANADTEGVTLAASSPQPITAPISGLMPRTRYHLRIIAKDSNGAEATGPEVVFFTLAPAPTFPACPNDNFRNGELSPFGFPSAHLPDCRSYEQATPINKNGGDVQSFLSYAKAGVDGNSVVFGSTFGVPDAEGAQQLPFFLAQRGAGESGWSSRGLLPPASLGEKGDSLRGWTPDFSSTFASATRLVSPFTEALFELHSDGSPPTQVAPLAQIEGAGAEPTYNYAGASDDGSIVLFESKADLSGAVPSYPLLKGGARNLYAWDKATGALALAGQMNSEPETKSLLPKGTYAGPYDWIAGAGGGANRDYYLGSEHAISGDGSVFFTSASDGQLYQRLNPTAPQSEPGPNGYVEDGHCAEPDKACTIHISATQKSNGGPDQNGPDPAGPQPAAFMAASADGNTAFFTSSEKLTNDANTGPEQPPAQIGAANLADPDPNATKNEAFIPTTHALGLAVDPKGEYIYWAEPVKGTIARAKLKASGSGIEGLPEPSFIDPGETKAITFPNSEPGVYHSAPSHPRYVAVDDEYVYWTNTGPAAGEESEGVKPGGALEHGGTIGRARIDGTGPEPVQPEFITGASNPQGIAINADHIYWANAGQFTNYTIAISRATIEGSDLRQSFIKTGTGMPIGLALSSTHVYVAAFMPASAASAINSYSLSDGDADGTNFVGFGRPGDVNTIGTDIYWTIKDVHPEQDEAVPAPAGTYTPFEPAIGRMPLSAFVGNINCGPNPSCDIEALSLAGAPLGLGHDGADHLYFSTNGESARNPGNDLYRYQAGASPLLEDLTPVPGGNGAEVQGVLGASADGSYLYFVANGVLGDSGEGIPGNCHGRPFRQTSGTCNLYLWHEGTTTYIAGLRLDTQSDQDSLNLAQSTSGFSSGGDRFNKTSFLSADGRTLLFRSTEQLTEYDNHDTPEFYLYRVGVTGLTCVTCQPSGAAPSAEAKLNSMLYPSLGPPPGGVASVPPRALSANGNRIFFETTESLVAADTNGEDGCPLVGTGSQPTSFSCLDVYEWEAPDSGTCTEGGPAWSELNQGCIYLTSTGKSAYPSFFVDASESGDDVFFITRDPLVGQDDDSITDVYDARVDGGLVSQNAEPQPPCEVEGCLPGATPPPSLPAPPNISGPPDPKPKRCAKGKKCKKKHHKKKHKHRHKKAAKHKHHKRGAGER